MATTSLNLTKDYPFTTNCQELNNQIEKLLINKDYWAKKLNTFEVKATENYLTAKRKWFNQYGCELVLNQNKFDTTQEIINVTNEKAKAKIDAEVQKQVDSQKRLAYIVLGAGVIMLLFIKIK